MISKRIKGIREKANMSQQEFGKYLGVSRDVIGNIEYGRVAPKEPFLSLLCSVFNINMNWLLTGEGESTDENLEMRKNIDEAIKILGSLLPELQEYAIQQLRGLLEVQNKIKK